MDAPIISHIDGADPELAATLATAALPVDDLRQPGRHFFRFADCGGLIGFVGWEDLGDAALLRSLVVVPSRRGQGWGKVLTDWALLRLAEQGVSDAFVLTTTIQDWAERLGFRRIEREAAPQALRATRQFTSLCPASAILLHRSLP